MTRSVFKRIIFCSFISLVLSITISAQQSLPIIDGPFKPTEESLKQYQYPKWFRDAKFGIWSHWGPQAVPRQGDWYARYMYIQGSNQYKSHLANYGHPSKFGFKDIIPLWKAEKWDPEKLMALYKKVGAKYFVSMGSHHDNFFLWNSKINPYNSVNMGPKKDVVAIWQKAAKKEGLRFGVSEHLQLGYVWYQISHLADTSGPMKGVPYDGADPKYAALYHNKIEGVNSYKLTGIRFVNGVWTNMDSWFNISDDLRKDWYLKIKELLDTYHPDLLYSDGPFNWGNVSYSMLANYYNGNMKANGGKLEAVYNAKYGDSKGMYVEDLERAVKDTISIFPWQTCTSLGDWFYRTGQRYKTSDDVIQMLVDNVSKNGNLLLNVVQTPEGDLEPDVLKILDEIANWIAANGEGIYGSRPWKVYGEKPSGRQSVLYGRENNNYNAKDIRFTNKGNTLYLYCLGKPTEDIWVASLGKNSKYEKNQIASIEMLGNNEKLKWEQQSDALVINKPAMLPDWKVIGFRINFKKTN